MSEGSADDSLLFSYLSLRKSIGVLGIALPFALVFGERIIFGIGLRGSISAYYHTGMRDVFVGTLCVIGVFLFSYKGYGRADNVAGNLACIFAIGVALFPTTREGATQGHEHVVGIVHLSCALLFFCALIYFSLVLFTKGSPSPTARKVQRNRVYRICGYVMAGCIAAMVVLFALPDSVTSPLDPAGPVFWLESIAVVSFGISWLTKGEAILKDR